MISIDPRTRRERGFTLIEAIIAIVLTGIIAGTVSVFIVKPIRGYLDAVRRAELTDAADTAIRRLARDVRTALPNSMRTSGNQCIEFLPIVASGRYRESTTSSGSGNVFNFTTSSGFTFDVLAGSGVDASIVSALNPYQAVVFNLGVGITGSDAYAGANRRAITGVGSAGGFTTVTLNAGSRYQYESPGRRFQVIPNYTVQYSCTGGATGKIVRTEQTIGSGNACPFASPLRSSTLLSNVDCTNSAFSYTSGAMQRDGLLTITVRMSTTSEQIQLFDEINVNNVP